MSITVGKLWAFCGHEMVASTWRAHHLGSPSTQRTDVFQSVAADRSRQGEPVPGDWSTGSRTGGVFDGDRVSGIQPD